MTYKKGCSIALSLLIALEQTVQISSFTTIPKLFMSNKMGSSLHQSSPSSSSSSSSVSPMSTFEEGTVLPSLIVFDLDNTLWTPELYQLRKLQRMKVDPIAGQDVTLFPVAQSIIESVRSSPDLWSNTKFAVASRTQSVKWAHALLEDFGLYDFFDYVEIFPGDKKTHFSNLKELSGVGYQDMLFFDDSRDGRYGNCVPVSQLGVLSVHTPKGLYDEEIWTNAIKKYSDWSKHKTPNSIVEWDYSVTSNDQPSVEGGSASASANNKRFNGVVKMINEEKRYGFIRYGGQKTRDVFFHFNNLPGNSADTIEKGDKINFKIVRDPRNGKNAAADITVDGSSDDGGDKDLVELRAFSMNLPFAALLANEYKTLETRNGTMFRPYPEGTKMLLHVGQRIYPDGNRHLDVMKSGGLGDDEISKLKSLPKNFGKGMAVAIVEIGKTYETTLAERCDPDFQRKVGAFGEDSGMRATEIRRVEYLKSGVKVSARGGVFKVNIDRNVIPDGWLED